MLNYRHFLAMTTNQVVLWQNLPLHKEHIMAAKTVVAGSTVSASQLKDLFRQIDDGSINGRVMQAILEHRNPWEIPMVFTVTSDGRTGDEFIETLEAANCNVSDNAKNVMRQPAFISSTGQTYNLVVIKGDEFEDTDRITSRISEEAARRGYLTPPAEVAPLLRELLSDEELKRMGLYWLIVMHEPIADSNGLSNNNLLGLRRDGDDCWLRAYNSPLDYEWRRESGFVFLAPQD